MPTQPIVSDSSRSGWKPAADDELGRAPADVDDEPRLERARQFVRDAEVGETRLLVAADDVDRKADRALGAPQELARVRRDAKRVRRDHAHRRRVQAGQPLAEAREACERRLHRRGLQPSLGVERRRPGAASRATCRADRSGRPRPGRSAIGSCSSRGRRRPVWSEARIASVVSGGAARERSRNGPFAGAVTSL